MRMQAIPISNPSAPSSTVGVQSPSPQQHFVDASGNVISYQDYEFVNQTPSPNPPVYQAQQHQEYQSQPTPSSHGYHPQQQQSYPTSQQVEKVGYPEAYPPTPGRGESRRPPLRYVRMESPRNVESRSLGIVKFFRSIFYDDESEAVEKAIIEEAKRIADTEESIENELGRIDREERSDAWERISNLTEEPVKISAIQAEIARSQVHGTQATERRNERARQRDNAREELESYRSQRALVQKLKILAFGFTVLLAARTISNLRGPKCAGQQPSKGSNSNGGSLTSKVLVAKESPSTQPQGQSNRRSCW